MAHTKLSNRSNSKGIDGSYRFLQYTIGHNQPVFQWLLKVDYLLRRFDKIRSRTPDIRVIDTALAAAGGAFLESRLGLPDPKVSTSPREDTPWPACGIHESEDVRAVERDDVDWPSVPVQNQVCVAK